MIAAHPALAVCALITHDEDPKGQVPMGLVVLKTGVAIAEADLQQLINPGSS